MKNFKLIVLCALLFATQRLSAQLSIYGEAYGAGITFEAFGGSTNNITEDATVAHTGSKSLKIVMPATGYTGGAMKAATPQNLSTYNAVTFWVKASVTETFDKAGLSNNATTAVFQTEYLNIAVTTAWQKVTIPIPNPAKLTAEDGLFHFAEGGGTVYTLWFDDIQYETVTLGATTAAMATETISKSIGDAFSPNGATCSIGGISLSITKACFNYTSSNTGVATMNNATGVGTAVAGGTTNITATMGATAVSGTLTVNVTAAPSGPTVAAATPTKAAADVLSVFSDAYTNIAATDFYPNWGQTTVVTDVMIAGNNTKRYANINYQGIQFASAVNASAMQFLHIDYWSSTVNSFDVFLINTSPATVEQKFTFTPTLSGWNSIDIPLSSYSAIALNNIGQFKLEGRPSGGTVYLDNIYFYKTAVVLPTEPMVAAPTPTRPAANVISLFSDASGYTNVAGTDFFPNWGQTTVVADVMVASNPTKKYTTMNYQGIQFASSVNASSMTNLHFDLWTPNCTAFEVSLINTSPSTVEQAVTVTPTLSGWNSFDIQLSSYTNINKASINQIKLVATPFGSSTVYLDNLYFWTTVTPATITNFTVPAKMVGDAAFTLTAPTSNSSGAFTYMSSNTSVATISGTTVTIVGGGTSIITATQAAAGAYGSGSITANLVVSFAVPMTAATTPTRLAANVISLFSGAYTDVAGTDWFPNWGQSTVVTDVMIAGNPTKKYDNLNYQGIQLASPINVSTMQKLHFDLWTPNCTSFEVSLINQGIGEQAFTVTPTTMGWNSFDIALSVYNTVNLANVGQIKFVGLPSGSAVVYIDNLYFWKAPIIPVELVSFKAKAVNQTTVLTWNTASERGNQGFTIERSVNGSAYTAIGQVKGNGTTNTPHDYTFTDNTPSVNINYYRLRQTDFDGKENLSSVVSVLFGKGGLVVKNTLAHDAVDIVVGDASPVTVSVFNVSGQEIFTTKMQGTQSIDVSVWVAGLYIVRTSTGDVGRFVKQ